MALRVIAAAIVAAAEIAVVGHVHVTVVVVLVVVVVVVRGLVEHALAGVPVRADVVEAGIARKRAAGLVAAAPGTSPSALVAEGVAVAESLPVLSAAHHAADAREQQRAADDAGCRRRRCAEEGAAATADRRGTIALARSLACALAVRLSVRRLAVARLGLLHRLAAVPH